MVPQVDEHSFAHNKRKALSHRIHALLVDDGVLHRNRFDVELTTLRQQLILHRFCFQNERCLSTCPTSTATARLKQHVRYQSPGCYIPRLYFGELSGVCGMRRKYEQC